MQITLVDASLYIFRAWHSMPAEIVDREGQPANAVHGFARFVCELLEQTKPLHISIAFDEALETCYRNEIYPQYKANREPAPEELKRQFGSCQQLCRLMGLPVLANGRYEADDLIGTALHRLRAQGFKGLIVSADKDLSQLLQGDDEQWDFGRNQRWNHSGVKARHGVRADQIADYLGLCGDAVDNIPGVRGIGQKTAATLLSHFGSLDELLTRIDEVEFLRLRGAASHAVRLRDQREIALLSRELATICCDAPLPDDYGTSERRAPQEQELDAFCEAMKIGPMTRRRIQEASKQYV